LCFAIEHCALIFLIKEFIVMMNRLRL